MKTMLAGLAAAAMLVASPAVMSDPAEAHSGYWNKHGHHRHWVKHHHKRKLVRKRHHRWVHRGGVVIKIIVYPGYPAYHGCGGYCW